MTQEEKDIIYKDACCRLPYHPYAAYILKDGTIVQAQLTGADDGQYYGYILDTWGHIPDYDVKLYLRPLSSMTEEEKREFDEVLKSCNRKVFACPDKERRYKFFDAEQEDFMNKHHFDYRGLIGKGLALEAPESMYN